MANKINRDIKYVSKDFAEYRTALINYAKNYFPDTYTDFNESSPAMMFLEMSAYVGDVLSFYGDVQLQESFLYTVDERINLYNLSQGHGYKPKTVVPSSVDIEIFQLIPSIGEGIETRPDYKYSLIVEPHMQCQTSDGTKFRTVDAVDFRFSSSYDPTETSVYSVADDGAIEYYLLKKSVKAVSGEMITREYPFGDPKKYDKIVLPNANVTDIIDIVDNDGNDWHEVQHMAQDLVPLSIRNTPYNNPELAQYRSSAPYVLCYKQVERRYITRLRPDEFMEIQFGAGLSSEADEEIIPNPFNVAMGLDYFERVIDVSLDPLNFLYTKTYGTAPNNVTLTVRYATAIGLSDNVNAGTITTITSANIINPSDTLDPTVLTVIRNSLAINNTAPAYGGQNRKSLEVIREEAIANFAAQNRAVTKEDYILRCFAMPSKFGSVSKAYIEQDQQLSRWNEYDKIPNPYALNLYVLSYDADRKLVPVNPAIRENLVNYISQYRMMTDAINIKTPFVVHLGIDFEILTKPQENSNEVLLRCVDKVIQLFDPDKMEINQPILISKLYTEIDQVEGVQTVQDIKFVNLFDTNDGYSGNVYDMETATRNGIVYPSLDPMIFEIKYPRRDIKGRVNDL
tara:strand:- start:1496 stop:3370 length:1875 start_codon:yes stop_codon:yes gene_type:complete